MKRASNWLPSLIKATWEYAGLVKFDLLGLRTLTIINWALEIYQQAARGENGEPPLDIAAIPDDKKSFDMLQRSETTAVFQPESRGMKDPSNARSRTALKI